MDIEKNNLLLVEIKHLIQTEDMDIWNYKNELISLIDTEIARQSEEVVACPNCNGSGVYQEYDEYDRYHVYACHECEGTGEIARQSVTSAEVQEAIEWAQGMEILYTENEMPVCANCAKLANASLQAYQPWIPCSERMPTEDDADENGHILAYSDGLQRSTICLWYHIIGDNTTTHWRKNIEPPKGESQNGY